MSEEIKKELIFKNTEFIFNPPVDNNTKAIGVFEYTGDDSDIIEVAGCSCLDKKWGNGKLFATYAAVSNVSNQDLNWLNKFYPKGYEEITKTLNVAIRSNTITQIGMQKSNRKYITLKLVIRIKLPNYPNQ